MFADAHRNVGGEVTDDDRHDDAEKSDGKHDETDSQNVLDVPDNDAIVDDHPHQRRQAQLRQRLDENKQKQQ